MLPQPVLEALLAQSSELLVVSDARGAITWTNSAWRVRTGWEHCIGALLPPSLVPDAGQSAPQLQALLDQALRLGHLDDTVVQLQLHAPAHGSAPASSGGLWLRLRIGSVGAYRLWTMRDIGDERRAETESRRLGELLDMAQEFGRLGVWERDIATGRGHWDAHVFRYWGLDPADGTPDFDQAVQRIHPEDRLQHVFAESTAQPGRYAQRYRVFQPDGSLRWLHSQWEIKADSGGVPSHAVGVIVDDTEVIALARSLDDATAQLSLAVELGQIAIWRQDLHSDRMVYNPRGFEVLGLPYRPEGMPMAEVHALIHPKDLPGVLSAAQQALTASGPTDMEARYLRSDGSWRHVLTRRVLQRDARGRPSAFIGVALDISESREAALALRQANERILLATRGAGIGTWELDMRSGEVRWDEQMYRLRGLEPPTAPQQSSSAPMRLRRSLAHPDELHLLLEANRIAVDERQMASYEFRVRWPDGSYRWLASRSVADYDADGRPLRQIGVDWDVHERVSAEAVRREALAAQRQNEARSQFFARMSHELRTPLNAILGFTQLLERETQGAGETPTAAAAAPGAESQRVKLRHIRHAAEHLLTLVDEVLDLTSLEAGALQMKAEAVALDALLTEVFAAVDTEARQGTITLQREACGLTVLADRERLHQVLLKLLDQRIRRLAPGRVLRLVASVQGDEARLCLSDNDHRPSSSEQLQLFEPYGRGPRGEEADSGVRLALVKALLAGMGGRIELAGADQPGNRLIAWLPLATSTDSGLAADLAHARAQARPLDAARPAGTSPASSAEQSAQPQRVLYIEDNPVNVILVEELIAQRGGLALVCEPTGSDGVARARQWRPQLVLIDMQLPDIDGFEVLRRLRADPLTAGIRCIALSANAMPEDMARAIAAGFDDYWTKPIRFEPFLGGLDRLFPRQGKTPT